MNRTELKAKSNVSVINHPEITGKVMSIDGEYVVVRLDDGDLKTFKKPFLIPISKKIPGEQPDLFLDQNPGIKAHRDNFIQEFLKTGNRDLYRLGSDLSVFLGFGRFLKWLDNNRTNSGTA